MIRKKLVVRLRPVAFAAVTATIGVAAATVGLSPAENAAASERGSVSVAQTVADSTVIAAFARILVGEATR